jgi:hypothetical protein
MRWPWEMSAENYSQQIKQGTTEAWFDQIWAPYWTTLNGVERNGYYDFWQASKQWREANDFIFDSAAHTNMEQDAKESERYLSQWRQNHAPKRSWLKKIFDLR